tara:strand:- start:29566 stop:30450 length:885 start_codon:yes stop_codon:yes gene_type:complete
MNQKGIALIQILLITAILSVFALYLLSTARGQVHIAQSLNDKSSALIELHNARAELLFRLLTEPKQYPIENQRHDNDIVRQWNFHGQFFNINSHVEVAIQDQAGLLLIENIPTTTGSALLVNEGMEQHQANSVVARLLDWQDVDSIARLNGQETGYPIRNGKVTYIGELQRIPGVSDSVISALRHSTTLYRYSNFNPLLAPSKLLTAYIGTNAQQIIDLRNEGTLTPALFKNITRIKETNNDSDEDVTFNFSYVINLNFKSIVGGSIVKQYITLRYNPYVKGSVRPIDVLINRS